MKSMFRLRPAIAALTLAATVTTLVAPLAEASHVRNASPRYKGAPVVRRAYEPTHRARIVYREHSDAAPLLIGLIGGFVLGSAIANSQPVVHAQYSYWDPYCEVSFSSLDAYRAHFYRHRHPRIVRVINVSNGHCVRDLRWSGNGWGEYHGDWDD